MLTAGALQRLGLALALCLPLALSVSWALA
jgi:hypothetical protein